MIKISPSMLSCDFANMESEAKLMESIGADMLHIDVMDGHFVPNITLGSPVLRCLDKKTSMFMDVHLMISEPLKYIDDFVKAGADLITFHIESCSDVQDTITKIKNAGIKASLSVKPNTPVESVFPFLNHLDMVLIMTVEPGFGGQSFIYDTIPKITALKSEIEKRNLSVDIQVDGGINAETAKLVKEAGANVLVAGSYIFGANNLQKAINSLR